MPEGNEVEGSTEKVIGISAGPIGWIVINNPARRNAMSRAMWETVPPLLDTLCAMPDTRLIVVTGAGGKAFISGADISEFEKQRASLEANKAYDEAAGAAFGAFADCILPTIAMVRGPCIGGGLATAISCDIRIATDTSIFGIPAAKLGVGYQFDGIQRLMSLIGPARTKQLMYTAEFYKAERAVAMGLIDESMPAEELEPRLYELAGMIAANAPLSIRAAKLAVDEAVKDPDLRNTAKVQAAIDTAWSSDDVKEGHRAFLEKRKANFTGK
jgi:enoyl-CoA hydratase/carnithine racemase